MTRGRKMHTWAAPQLARVNVYRTDDGEGPRVAWIAIAPTDNPMTLARFVAERRRASGGWSGPVLADLEPGDGHPDRLDLGVVLA